MACVEDFQRHSWADDGTCTRDGCTATKPNGQSRGAVQESLDGIKAEMSGVGPVAAKDSSKWQVRKQKKGAEEDARKLLNRVNAKSFLQLAEGAKGIAFKSALGLSLPPLASGEEESLAGQLTRILDLLEWDISNPYVLVCLFLLTYGQISYRQYADAMRALEVDDDARRQ